MKQPAEFEWQGPAMDAPGERFLPAEAGGRWDDQPVPQLHLGDLDGQALADFRQRLSGQPEPPAGIADDAALLEQLQLFHLKRAAVLLFHAAPEKLIGGAYVRIGRFRGDHQLLAQHSIGGPLFSQFEHSLALLEEHLRHDPHSGEPRPAEACPLPLAALREALLNAIVHKDYASGIPVQIRLHDERISLWNPARLPEGWSLASLRAHHLSRPANPDIANAFQRAGLIEGWGLGIDRLISACRAAGLAEPQLRHEQGGLWLEFVLTRPKARQPARAVAWRPAGHVAGEAARQATGEVAVHVTGHGAGEGAGEDAVYVAGEVAGHAAGHVTGEVRRLIQACNGVMTRKALQDALGLRSDANFRTLYLVPALEAGLIEMTIPDKPKSSRQQYRLSSRGTALRQQK